MYGEEVSNVEVRNRVFNDEESDEEHFSPFIIDFFDENIQAETNEGYTLNKTLNFDDEQLEDYHDFIQYLFPLPEPSPVNPSAPVITKEVRDIFLARDDLRLRLGDAFERMLTFFGLELKPALKEDEGVARDDDRTHYDYTTTVEPMEPRTEFELVSARTWRVPVDYNHRRITRIIRCLRVLGDEHCAEQFYKARDFLGRGVVSAASLMYWRGGNSRPLHLPPEENDENATGVEWLRENNSQ